MFAALIIFEHSKCKDQLVGRHHYPSLRYMNKKYHVRNHREDRHYQTPLNQGKLGITKTAIIKGVEPVKVV